MPWTPLLPALPGADDPAERIVSSRHMIIPETIPENLRHMGQDPLGSEWQVHRKLGQPRAAVLLNFPQSCSSKLSLLFLEFPGLLGNSSV